MIITDLSQIDFSKYKRFFAFGCSFTQYRWPTWCDIIAKDNPDLEYYNIGKSGAGNTYIFNQINQYANKMNFDEHDLVMVLWSSFYREDRYMYEKGGWKTPGNIYSQFDYDEKFVTEMCCPRGFTLQDLALIDTASRWFTTAEFTVAHSLAIPYDMQNHYSGKTDELAEEFNLNEVYGLYVDLPQSMYPSLIDCFPEGWKMEYMCKNDQGESYTDYHPTVMGYVSYLTELGIDISKVTQTWAFAEHQRMLRCEDTGEIGNTEPKVFL